MFINSNPPQFKKAKLLAVEISNFEALFLDHTSYVDTTNLQELSESLVGAALADQNRIHGYLSPTLKNRIVKMVLSHEVMEPDKRQKFL